MLHLYLYLYLLYLYLQLPEKMQDVLYLTAALNCCTCT